MCGQCPHLARQAGPAPSTRLSCVSSVMPNARVCRGNAGASRPRPSPEGFHPSGLSFGGIGAGSKGPAHGGCAGLEGVTARIRARRDAKHARFSLSVTATAVTPSPLGKVFLLHALGRGSPTVAPLRVRVVRSVMVEGGGDLLRRPTEITPAPPAMHRCGEPLHSRPVPPRQPTSCDTPDRPTNLRATRAAHRCRPAASGQLTCHPKSLMPPPRGNK